jgi:uncharacterized coiled-coil protein SlyX
MAEGTRLFQLTESLKECQEAVTQQQAVNTNVQQQLQEVTDMLRTLMANQHRPPPHRPPDGDNRAFHLPFGHDRNDHPEDREVGWNQGDQGDFDIHRDDRQIHTRTLQTRFSPF